MAGGKKSPSSQFKELTKAEYAQCAKIIRDNPGISRNEVARRMGRSAYSVTKMAHAQGLTFDRTKTAEATKAMVADAAARRAALAEALLDDAERMRQRLWEKSSVVMGGPNGPEVVHLDLPTLRDAKDGMAAVSIGVKAHMDLLKHDAGDGADTARSILTGLARQFGLIDE